MVRDPCRTQMRSSCLYFIPFPLVISRLSVIGTGFEESDSSLAVRSNRKSNGAGPDYQAQMSIERPQAYRRDKSLSAVVRSLADKRKWVSRHRRTTPRRHAR